MRLLGLFVASISILAFPMSGLGESLSQPFHQVPDTTPANEAYEKHEKSLALYCYYPYSAFTTEQESVDFAYRTKLDIGQNQGEFSLNRFDGSVRLTSVLGGARIVFSEWMTGGKLESLLTLKTDAGAKVSVSGITQTSDFSLPSQVGVHDFELAHLYRELKLESMRCSIYSADKFSFDEKDLASTMHIIVHPHKYYDPEGKISSQINSWQDKQGVRTIALLEGRDQRTLKEIISGTPFKANDPKLSFTPLSSTRFAVAYNGGIEFGSYKGKLPTQFVLTGGFFNECMTHMLDHLFQTLRESAEAKQVSLILPMDGILVQERGQNGIDGYPGMSPETTLSELRRAHPDAFNHLMDKFLAYHVANWEEAEDPKGAELLGLQRRGIDIEMLDVDGNSIFKKSWGGSEIPHTRIEFRLISK